MLSAEGQPCCTCSPASPSGWSLRCSQVPSGTWAALPGQAFLSPSHRHHPRPSEWPSPRERQAPGFWKGAPGPGTRVKESRWASVNPESRVPRGAVLRAVPSVPRRTRAPSFLKKTRRPLPGKTAPSPDTASQAGLRQGCGNWLRWGVLRLCQDSPESRQDV